MSHDIFNLDDLNTEVEDIDEPNSGAGTGDESKYVVQLYTQFIKREKPPSLTGVTFTILIKFVNILTCLFKTLISVLQFERGP